MDTKEYSNLKSFLIPVSLTRAFALEMNVHIAGENMASIGHTRHAFGVFREAEHMNFVVALLDIHCIDDLSYQPETDYTRLCHVTSQITSFVSESIG